MKDEDRIRGSFMFRSLPPSGDGIMCQFDVRGDLTDFAASLMYTAFEFLDGRKVDAKGEADFRRAFGID